MLILSNRELTPPGDAFGTSFQPGADALSMASVARSGSGSGWQLASAQAAVKDDAVIHALMPLFQGSKPVLVWLHGNSNTPTDCFERCERLGQLYGLEVVGFSWPSEGFLPDGTELPRLPPAPAATEDENALAAVKIDNRSEGPAQRILRRYRQAKLNAQDSTDALARFLRLVGVARLYTNQQPFTLGVHSLGVHYLQNCLQVAGATESVGTAHNIALLAPCARAEGHLSWLRTLQPKGQVFVSYNKGDSVLFGAFVADGQQLKLGTDPGSARLAAPNVRYISFSNAKVDAGGHGYFVMAGMPAKTRKLFKRILGSERDIQGVEFPRQVYPIGCDGDGVTCYMAKPEAEPADGS